MFTKSAILFWYLNKKVKTKKNIETLDFIQHDYIYKSEFIHCRLFKVRCVPIDNFCDSATSFRSFKYVNFRRGVGGWGRWVGGWRVRGGDGVANTKTTA